MIVVYLFLLHPISDENVNRIEASELLTRAYQSEDVSEIRSMDQSESESHQPNLMTSPMVNITVDNLIIRTKPMRATFFFDENENPLQNEDGQIEAPTNNHRFSNDTQNGQRTPQSVTPLKNGLIESSFTNGDLDAIESIDTEPEVVENSVEFVPENITGTKVEMRNNPSITIPDEKYLSLIESSPHTIELHLSPSVVANGIDQNGEINDIHPTLDNQQKFFSETRQSITDLILPAPEFSEALSTPRKPNLRKENDYVKFKPFQPSSNTSIGSVRETPL